VADLDRSRGIGSQAIRSCYPTTSLDTPTACRSGVQTPVLQVQWHLAKRYPEPCPLAIESTMLKSMLKSEQITSLQIRTWLEIKELITIEQVGSLLKGLRGRLPPVCISANGLDSTRQPQRSRCLPSHHRGLPTRLDKYNRRACSPCPKLRDTR
jgi:hypothetical protein